MTLKERLESKHRAIMSEKERTLPVGDYVIVRAKFIFKRSGNMGRASTTYGGSKHKMPKGRMIPLGEEILQKDLTWAESEENSNPLIMDEITVTSRARAYKGKPKRLKDVP